MINKKKANHNIIKQKAEELIKNLVKNSKESFGTKFEPIYKDVQDNKMTQNKYDVSLIKVSKGKKEKIGKEKKSFIDVKHTKRKSNLEIFQSKVESSHDKIVRKMPQFKENETLVRSLINNTNNTLNADIKISSLGRSILDYSNTRKNIKSVESKNDKQLHIQYSENPNQERKCVSKIVFNSVKKEEGKDNNLPKMKRKHEKLSKIIEEKNTNVLNMVNNDLIDVEPSIRVPIDFIQKTKLNIDEYKYYLETSQNNNFSYNINRNNEKFVTDDIKIDVETNNSLSKQNIIFEELNLLKQPSDEKNKETVNKLYNKLNLEILDSSLNSIKNDLNNINNDLTNFRLNIVKLNECDINQEYPKEKIDFEVQNSIQLLIDSPSNQITNFFSKEKDIILIKDHESNEKSMNVRIKQKGDINNTYSNTYDLEEDIEEFRINENINTVYSSDTKTSEHPNIKTKLMKSIKSDEEIEKLSIHTIEEETYEINSVIRKYLFDTTAINSKNDLNESKASLEKDLNTITSRKKYFENIEKIYTKKIENLRKQIKEVENLDGYELEKYKVDKEKEIEKLFNKLNEIRIHNMNTSSLTQTNRQNSYEDSIYDYEKIKTYKNKYSEIKSSINQIENNYKNIIRQLYNEIQSSKFVNPSLVLEGSLLKELKDILNEKQTNNETSLHNVSSFKKKKFLRSISSNDTNNNIHINLHEKKEKNNDSMMKELENFKQEDLSSFKFEIPAKYQMGKNVKVVKEISRKDGAILKYYENSILEVIYKNKTTNRIFPDGYTITFYSNKDIKQNYKDGRVIYYFAKNKSLEFNFPKNRYIAYKFKNNQLEKHFYDGKKYIRFSDGSFKIIRPNGEELNEFNDGQIQRKNKFGQITFTSNI